MPWISKKEAVLAMGAAAGVALAGTAQADPRGHDAAPIILAQSQDEVEEEKRKRRPERAQEQRRERRQQGREERQDRGEKRKEQVQEKREKTEDIRERVEERRERRDPDQSRERRDAQQEEKRGKAEQTRERQKAQQEQKRREAQQARERQKDEQTEKPRERVQKPAEERRERVQDRRTRVEEKRDDRGKRVEEKRDDRRERVRDRRERVEDKRDDRRQRVEERIERPELTREVIQERRKKRREFTRENLKDITRGRRRTEEGGRVVIEEPGNRRIIRDRGRIIIEHDETDRMRGAARDFRRERGPGGRTRTIITRPNGVQIITVEGDDGRMLRRIKRFPNGREVVLINNEYRGKRRSRNQGGRFSFYINLPDLVWEGPREEYYAYAEEADEEDIYELLSAPPVEAFEEDYTLDEIRYSPDIRDRFRKLNLDTINFEFGSWAVREDQIDRLATVADVIIRILEKNPEEVFLIAGHTDAVGSDEDNLSLSDRRAETVARILTDEFAVPPENLVTQGYGESDLLVETEQAEVRNRRVEFMRITPALAQAD